MHIKDILIGLYDFPGLECALSIVEKFKATPTGLVPFLPLIGSVGSPIELSVPVPETNDENASLKLVEAFRQAASKRGIQAETIVETGMEGGPQTFGSVARTFDLSIVSQPNGSSPGVGAKLIESALFDSGRPLLVIPFIQKNDLQLEHVLICWDGGRASARALADSIPFLKLARSIEILTIHKHAELDQNEGVRIRAHLAHHALEASFHRVPTDMDIGSTILSYAADVSADLIVMGGYDHSPLRELIFGGATRDILSAMTVPVLLSH